MFHIIFLFGLFLFFPLVFLLKKKLKFKFKFSPSATSVLIALVLVPYLIVSGFGVLMSLAWGGGFIEALFSFLVPIILVSALYFLFKRIFTNFQTWMVFLLSLIVYPLGDLFIVNFLPQSLLLPQSLRYFFIGYRYFIETINIILLDMTR